MFTKTPPLCRTWTLTTLPHLLNTMQLLKSVSGSLGAVLLLSFLKSFPVCVHLKNWLMIWGEFVHRFLGSHLYSFPLSRILSLKSQLFLLPNSRFCAGLNFFPTPEYPWYKCKVVITATKLPVDSPGNFGNFGNERPIIFSL